MFRLHYKRNMSGDGEQRIVIKGNSSKYVKLNVSGALFYTTIGTLTKHDNMLRAMFSGRMEVLTDSEGIDVSWVKFVILVYRDVCVCVFACAVTESHLHI